MITKEEYKEPEKEYDYPEYLIIGQNEFKKRVNLESVTQVKKY